MQMFNFDFMKAGQHDPIDNASGMMRNLSEAKSHCRNLYEGVGRAMGAQSVCVRENGASVVIYS